MNIQKVFKGLTIALCLCAICISILSPAAYAASGGNTYDIGTSYISSSITDEYELDSYTFNNYSGSWWQFVGSSVTCVDAVSMSYKVPSGSMLSDLDFYYYFLGADYQNGSMVYNYLDMSYYGGKDIFSFLMDLDFTASFINVPDGDMDISWQLRVKCYDASMNMLETLTSEVSETRPGGGATGSALLQSVELASWLPEDTAYFVPYVWLSVDPAGNSFSEDMTIFARMDTPLDLSVKVPAPEVVDTIVGYDGEGQLIWEHPCRSIDPDCMYHLEVHSDHYFIRCDCGWWYRRNVTSYYNSNDFNAMEELSFIGLDTDNDEVVDLFPGQSKDLPNRVHSDLRPYVILEFYDLANRVTPSVTLTFYGEGREIIASYDFIWSVDVHVEPYGIVMEGMDGSKRIHYIDSDFLVYDDLYQFHLGNTVHRYEWKLQYEGGFEIVAPAVVSIQFPEKSQ